MSIFNKLPEELIIEILKFVDDSLTYISLSESFPSTFAPLIRDFVGVIAVVGDISDSTALQEFPQSIIGNNNTFTLGVGNGRMEEFMLKRWDHILVFGRSFGESFLYSKDSKLHYEKYLLVKELCSKVPRLVYYDVNNSLCGVESKVIFPTMIIMDTCDLSTRAETIILPNATRLKLKLNKGTKKIVAPKLTSLTILECESFEDSVFDFLERSTLPNVTELKINLPHRISQEETQKLPFLWQERLENLELSSCNWQLFHPTVKRFSLWVQARDWSSSCIIQKLIFPQAIKFDMQFCSGIYDLFMDRTGDSRVKMHHAASGVKLEFSSCAFPRLECLTAFLLGMEFEVSHLLYGLRHQIVQSPSQSLTELLDLRTWSNLEPANIDGRFVLMLPTRV